MAQDASQAQEAGTMIVTAEQAAIMAGEAIAKGQAIMALPMVRGDEYMVHVASTARTLIDAVLGSSEPLRRDFQG